MTPEPHAALTALLPRLVAFARTMVGDRELARDLVQEAAARALAARRVPDAAAGLPGLDVPDRAQCRARRAALHAGRRSNSLQPPDTVDLWRFDNARIAKITVDQGLATLAPEHRDIIALIDIAGFSYAEAAEVIAMPVGTVMSRISRARMALLAAIEASSVRPLSPEAWKSSHGH